MEPIEIVDDKTYVRVMGGCPTCAARRNFALCDALNLRCSPYTKWVPIPPQYATKELAPAWAALKGHDVT